MKKVVKVNVFALLLILLLVSKVGFSQSNYDCHTGEVYASNLQFPAQNPPACWPDDMPPCEATIDFAPDPNSPIKYVKVVVHIFQNEDDPTIVLPPGNFTNSEEHLDVIRSWFHDETKGINARLTNLCDPLPKVPGHESPHIPDARIRFLFEGIENQDIFFYNEPELWAGGYHCGNLGAYYSDFEEAAITNNPIVQSDLNILNSVHIFCPAVSDCGNHVSYSGGGYTYMSSSCGELNNSPGIVLYGNFHQYMYDFSGSSTWVTYPNPPNESDIPYGGAVILGEFLHMISVDHPGSNTHLNIPTGINDHCDDTRYDPNSSWMNPNTDPSTINNLMDTDIRTGVQDRCGLTECQLGRAHHFLEALTPHYIRSQVNNFQFPSPWDKCKLIDSDLLIDGNQEVVWDKTKRLYSNVIVKKGSKLTINCEVFMPEEGKIIIEPDAELVLNGKITAGCNTWRGIEVWGDNSQSQYLVNGERAQGKFTGNPGALIENAYVAVQLWGPDEYINSGGLIYCAGTTFRNNQIAVDFVFYENFWPHPTNSFGQPRDYFASFKDCTFETTSSYAVDLPFDAFIKMNEVNGVRISGSSFSNTQILSDCNQIANYGHGIYATDSGFKVDALCTTNNYPCTSGQRSTFEGLGYGIYNSNTTGNKAYLVKEADFSGCFVGLYNNAASNGTIVLNDFYLGDIPDPCITTDQLGVMFEGNTSGFTFEQNNFSSVNGNVGTSIGTLSKSLGNFNNLIRKNTYSNLDYANVSNGDNATAIGFIDRGLHYLCNNNSGNGADFTVSVLPGTDRVRHSQGLEIEVSPNIYDYNAAGNYFSYTGNDFDNGGQEVDYYWYDAPNQKPISYLGLSNLNNTEAVENTCSDSYCEPPCKTKAETDLEKDKYYISQNKESLAKTAADLALAAGAMALADQKGKEAAYHRNKMDKEAFMVVLHLLHDTISFDPDTLNIWLENLDVFGVDMHLALQHQMKGDASAAQSFIQKAAQRESLSAGEAADLQRMPVLLSILYGKSPYNLTGGDLSQLQVLANDDESFTGNMAKNILTLYGYHFPLTYRLPNKNKSLGSSSSGKQNTTASKELWIHPNPSDGAFTFAWKPYKKEHQKGVLQISNFSGQIIYTTSLMAFEPLLIDLKEHSKGVYLYQLKVEGEVPQTGKIVIQ